MRPVSRILLAGCAMIVALAGCSATTRKSTSPIAAQIPPGGFDGVEPSASATLSSPKPSSTGAPGTSGEPSHNPDEPDDGPDDVHDKPKYDTKNPPPDDYRPPDIDGGSTGPIRLTVKIEPGCVEQGESMTISFKSKPDVQVAYFTGFKDDDGKSRLRNDRTNASGLWTTIVAVRIIQSPGQYDLFGAAADDKGSDGGHSGNWHFVVAKPGECTGN